jgi:hypothetical protein
VVEIVVAKVPKTTLQFSVEIVTLGKVAQITLCFSTKVVSCTNGRQKSGPLFIHSSKFVYR